MWSLGEFRPRLRKFAPVESLMTEFFAERITDMIETPHVRWPSHPHSMRNSVSNRESDEALDWHYDNPPAPPGVETYGPRVYEAVWASELPTEIMCNFTGREFQAEPFEVLLFDNSTFVHRQPRVEGREGFNRWFARAFFLRTAHVLDAPGVWQYEVPLDVHYPLYG